MDIQYENLDEILEQNREFFEKTEGRDKFNGSTLGNIVYTAGAFLLGTASTISAVEFIGPNPVSYLAGLSPLAIYFDVISRVIGNASTRNKIRNKTLGI